MVGRFQVILYNAMEAPFSCLLSTMHLIIWPNGFVGPSICPHSRVAWSLLGC